MTSFFTYLASELVVVMPSALCGSAQLAFAGGASLTAVFRAGDVLLYDRTLGEFVDGHAAWRRPPRTRFLRSLISACRAAMQHDMKQSVVLHGMEIAAQVDIQPDMAGYLASLLTGSCHFHVRVPFKRRGLGRPDLTQAQVSTQGAYGEVSRLLAGDGILDAAGVLIERYRRRSSLLQELMNTDAADIADWLRLNKDKFPKGKVEAAQLDEEVSALYDAGYYGKVDKR